MFVRSTILFVMLQAQLWAVAQNSTIPAATRTKANASATKADACETTTGVRATMVGACATMAGAHATTTGAHATMAGVPTSHPTDSLFQLQKTLTGDFIDFTVDNLGNLYLVSQSGQLKKMGPAGDSLAVFNNVRQYGKIHFIDVTNPLKVLLHFKDFGTVVVLDRFLNTRSTIDLRRQQLFQVKSIGQSYDNNIWVYDELESKLKRIGEDGRMLDQSADFRLIFDSTPSPAFIVDQQKQVFLYDSVKGVYIFDYYGAFKNRIRLLGWTDFTVIGNALFGRDAGMLYKYEPGSLNLQQYRIPEAMRDARKIKITPGNLYLLRDNRLEIYSYR